MFSSSRYFHSWVLAPVIFYLGAVIWFASFDSRALHVVAEINSPPVAVDDSYTVHGQAGLTPLTNDHDPDNEPFSLYSVTQPQHGTASVASSTLVNYSVASGYVGSDSFTYTIRDSSGNFGTATICITAVNQSPVAVTDAYTVHGQLMISPKDNDYDPDNDGVAFKALVTQPQHGTLTGYTTGVYTYRAAYGYVGSDSFTYSIQDGYGLTATGTVNINVVNQPPIAVPDIFLWKWGLLMRPTANDIDPDRDGLGFPTVVATTQAGALNGWDVTTYTYIPNNGTFADFFTYRVSDGLGLTSTGLSVILVMDNSWNLGNPSCTKKGVGRPVDVTTGNMYLRQDDYQNPTLSVTRSYNSKSQATGMFGRSWSSDYDSNVVADNSYAVRFRQGDGRIIPFYRTSTSGPFTPATPDFHAQLTQTGNGYTLAFQDGSTEQFDSAGKLLSFADQNGNNTSLTYGANNFLNSLTDTFGRQLSVTTNSNGQITSLADTLGTIATYT
jgi:hypothetical protein